jgi:hypothetical protein
MNNLSGPKTEYNKGVTIWRNRRMENGKKWGIYGSGCCGKKG